MVQSVTEQSIQKPRDFEGRWRTLFIFLIYVILSGMMTWPAIARLGTHLAGGRDDLWIHQWTFWWIKYAIQNGINPFYTDLLYYPDGVSLTSHNIAWFNIAVWLPLQAILGETAAYSLILIVVFALNGFAMFLLTRELTRSQAAAFIGGVVYAFWPYTMSHFDHANMMVIFSVPLTILYLHRTYHRQRVGDALLAACFLAMIGITRWQLLIMSSPVIGSYLLYLWLKFPTGRTQRALGLLVLTGGIATLLMAPLATPVVIDQITRDYPEDAFLNEPEMGRTDLLAYVTPSLHNQLWKEQVESLYENFAANKYYVPFLGFTTLLLTILGIVRRWSKTRFWLILALIYLILALGSELTINNIPYAQWPMPYRLVEDWFIFRIIRRPHRLNIFLSLPMGLLVAWGTNVLLHRRTRGRQVVLLGIFTGLILLEYNPVPFPTTPPAAPAWYRNLAQDTETFALLDLPLNNRGYDKWYMAYQISHGKPLLGGHVSRLPREAFDFMESVPFLRMPLQQDNLVDPDIVDVSRQLRLLAAEDVRYLVIHKQFANTGLQLLWKDWLTVTPYYEDEEVIVYNTDPIFGRDFDLTHQLTPELGLIQVAFSPQEAVQSGTIKVDARWGSKDAIEVDYDACLNLAEASGRTVWSHCEPMIQGWPTSAWQASEVARGSYVLPVNNNLEGTYDLTLTVADQATRMTVGQPMNLGNIVIHSLEPMHTPQVQWSDLVLLTGYDLKYSDEVVELVLYWQGLQQLDASYKVFVHLIDPATGLPVVQNDAIPRDWTYPTNIWEPGEVVRDVVSLPLDEVPNGQYEIWIGLYDQETEDRLPISSALNDQINDGAILLVTVQQ